MRASKAFAKEIDQESLGNNMDGMVEAADNVLEPVADTLIAQAPVAAPVPVAAPKNTFSHA